MLITCKLKKLRLSKNSILLGGGGQKNNILRQMIVTFVIKTQNLTVNIISPNIILKNTTHKKKLKYSPV